MDIIYLRRGGWSWKSRRLVFVVDSSRERENINFLVLRETAAVLKEEGKGVLETFQAIVRKVLIGKSSVKA